MSSLSIVDAARLVSTLHRIGCAAIVDYSDDFAGRLSRFLNTYREMQPKAVIRPLSAASEQNTGLTLSHTESLLRKLHLSLRDAAASGDLIDLWAIAGLGRKETRNAAVLAWLLNPRGSHGQGNLILKGLLSHFVEHQPTWTFDEGEFDRVVVRTEHQPLGDIHNRIDIALDGPSFILFLELKISSRETRDQISRYVRAAEQKRMAFGKKHAHVAYLAPARPTLVRSDIAYLTWRDLAEIIMTNLQGMKREHISRLAIERFANHINRF